MTEIVSKSLVARVICFYVYYQQKVRWDGCVGGVSCGLLVLHSVGLAPGFVNPASPPIRRHRVFTLAVGCSCSTSAKEKKSPFNSIRFSTLICWYHILTCARQWNTAAFTQLLLSTGSEAVRRFCCCAPTLSSGVISSLCRKVLHCDAR